MTKTKRPERIIDNTKLTIKERFNPFLFWAWLIQENAIAMYDYPAYKVFFDKLQFVFNKRVLGTFVRGILTFSLLSFVFTTVYARAGIDYVFIAIAIYFFFSLGQIMSQMNGINVGLRELTAEVKGLDL